MKKSYIYIVDVECQAIYHFYTKHKCRINITLSFSLSLFVFLHVTKTTKDELKLRLFTWLMYELCTCFCTRSEVFHSQMSFSTQFVLIFWMVWLRSTEMKKKEHMTIHREGKSVCVCVSRMICAAKHPVAYGKLWICFRFYFIHSDKVLVSVEMHRSRLLCIYGSPDCLTILLVIVWNSHIHSHTVSVYRLLLLLDHRFEHPLQNCACRRFYTNFALNKRTATQFSHDELCI